MDFKIITHECSLGDPLPELLKPFFSDEQDSHQSLSRKTFKQLLLNKWMDFEIISHEYFLGEPLPKFVKRFRSDEQNGSQS